MRAAHAGNGTRRVNLEDTAFGLLGDIGFDLARLHVNDRFKGAGRSPGTQTLEFHVGLGQHAHDRAVGQTQSQVAVLGDLDARAFSDGVAGRQRRRFGNRLPGPGAGCLALYELDLGQCSAHGAHGRSRQQDNAAAFQAFRIDCTIGSLQVSPRCRHQEITCTNRFKRIAGHDLVSEQPFLRRCRTGSARENQQRHGDVHAPIKKFHAVAKAFRWSGLSVEMSMVSRR